MRGCAGWGRVFGTRSEFRSPHWNSSPPSVEGLSDLDYPPIPFLHHKPSPRAVRHSSVILTLPLLGPALLAAAQEPEAGARLGAHLTTLAGIESPGAVAVGPRNRIFVVETGSHRVRVFDTGGSELTAFGERGGGPGELSFPEGIAIAPSGEIFVADTGNHRVQVFAADGALPARVGWARVGAGPLPHPARRGREWGPGRGGRRQERAGAGLRSLRAATAHDRRHERGAPRPTAGRSPRRRGAALRGRRRPAPRAGVRRRGRPPRRVGRLGLAPRALLRAEWSRRARRRRLRLRPREPPGAGVRSRWQAAVQVGSPRDTAARGPGQAALPRPPRRRSLRRLRRARRIGRRPRADLRTELR